MSKNQVDNSLALEFNESIKPDLDRILHPVFDHFGFTHFAHTRFTDGDKYLSVCADTDMARGFFRSALDVQMFFEKYPLPKYSKLKVIWDLQPDNALLEHLRSHGYHHGVTVFYRDETSIQGWNFAVNADNAEINRLYTQDEGIMEECIGYIQEASRGLFKHVPEEALATYQDNQSLDIDHAFDESRQQEVNHDSFLDSINRRYLFHHGGRDVNLTAVEFQCLKGLAQGLTAKAIARKRNISPRSVESCIDKIKDKFRVTSKLELVEAYHRSIHV